MLFKNYPTISYTFGSKTVTLVDIFKNVSFTNTDNNNAFDDYYIQDGETPEMISSKRYGTTGYAWLVLLTNNILDIKNDWFISAFEFNQKTETNFGGDAVYIPALPDLQENDIMVKVTAYNSTNATAINNQAYRHVSSFDPYFRVVRGICGGGTFANGDYILFARKNNDGSVTPLTFDNQDISPSKVDYTNILYIEEYKNSIDYIITGNGVILTPYTNVTYPGGTAIESKTSYLDTENLDVQIEKNFANTLIYYYGSHHGLLPSGISKVALATGNYNKYIKKQKIRLLKPELLISVVSAIQNALNGDNVGKIFKVEI